MSADNWAKCPRCVKRADAALVEKERAVFESYGAVPVAQFDEARAELNNERALLAQYDTHRTFREDYEIYGAEDGVVQVSYSGGCEECGLQLDFKHEHELEVDGG